MRHVLLDEFSILSIHHNPLDHFCPCIACSERVEIDASTQHHPTAFITTCHHQRQGQNYTFSHSAAMVLVRGTLFVHRSDCPVLTFWKLKFSQNEHGVAPTSLQQPTIPIAAVESDLIDTWPHKQKSFKINCSPIPSVAALTTAASSDSPLLKARTPKVLDHAFTNWSLHIATLPCVGFSRGVASSKVCITKHLNIVVQLGPWVSAGHSRVVDCVPRNSPEGSEVLCTRRSHFPH